mmetsp:Transcript_35971/g.69870  ORF Transcript_35971/g.69870 Transcript_35971/m.69870 type:complete len:355 (+) Transcript_35971:226-1290(+)
MLYVNMNTHIHVRVYIFLNIGVSLCKDSSYAHTNSTWRRWAFRSSSLIRDRANVELAPELWKSFANSSNVLISASAEADEDILARIHRFSLLHGLIQGMRSLQSRNDSLLHSACLEAEKALAVVNSHILSTSREFQLGVLWSNTGVVETRGNAVSFGDLARFLLQEIGPCAVKNSGDTLRKCGGVRIRVHAITTRFNANQTHTLIIREWMEHANGIRSAANARNDSIRKLTGLLKHLSPRFSADDGLEVSHDGREGVRADRGTNEVVRSADVGDPVSHSFVDCVLQSTGTGVHSNHLGSQHLHTEHIQSLSLDVSSTHVHDALQLQLRTGGRCCYSVLPRTRLSDDAFLPQTLG